MAVVDALSHKRVHGHVTKIAKHLENLRREHGDLAPGQTETTAPAPAEPTKGATK